MRRQQWVKWVQLVTVLVWSLFPPFYSPVNAIWVPSAADPMVPVWEGEGEPTQNPAMMDSDGDGLSDWLEQNFGFSPGNPDSDYDGLSDSFELWTSNTSPINWDSNSDGFSDHDAYYGCWNVNHHTAGYGATVYDWDGDGYYNPNDSWPFDSNNGSVPVPWSDIDGDGIHDNGDPYPSDPLNGSSPPLSSDMDLDGIPDSMDTHPNDAFRSSDHNNNGHNDGNDTPYNTDTDNDGHFDGNDTDPNNAALWNDQFPRNGINDQDEPPPSSGYDPWITDSDGDSQMDHADSHPGDASRWRDLNNNGFNDWEDTPYNMDRDNDGHFDGNDSDPDNGTLWNDHSPRDGINDPDTPPLTGGDGPMIADSDSDGRVDHSDSHPNDSARWSDWDNDVLNAELEQGLGTSPYHWDTDSDGLSDGEEVQYQTNPLVADMDGDGLTDREELLGTFGSSPRDKFSLSRGRGWGETYTDWHLADLTDTDGDGIPDKIEDLYAPYLNKQNAADAEWDADADGFTNLQAYLNGWTLRATINSLDRDGDGIEDAVEDLYPGILDKFNFADAVEDPDGDDLMNWQEVELPLQGYHPGDAQSRYAGVADHTARAWVALSGEVGLYLLQGGDWSSYRHLSRLPEGNYNAQMSNWVTMVDSDGTGLPDGLEAFLRDVAVEHGFVPGRVNPGDYDGDGMPDVWEWRYRGQLNLLSPTDAGPFGSVMPAPPLEPDASQFDLYLQEGVEAYQVAMGNYGAAMNTRRIQDLDADGLSNLMEYQLNTHPLIPDSDGDSIPDGVEYQYGSDPNNGNNLPTTLLEITGGSAQAAVVGAVSNSPLTVLAVRAGVPRGNYAVQFNTNGFGKLGSTMAGPWSTQLVSVTNDAGLASIYWQAPLAAGSGNLQVRGSDVGSAPQNISATAQPATGGGDGPGSGTGPGDGLNPSGPVTPISSPQEPILFTSERVITGSFIGYVGDGITEESSVSSVSKTEYVVYLSGPQNDSFDGDLDSNQNDLGDPRDENLELAEPSRMEVDEGYPGSVLAEWTEEESVAGPQMVADLTGGFYMVTNQIERMKEVPVGKWTMSDDTGTFQPGMLNNALLGVKWGYEQELVWEPGSHGWRGSGHGEVEAKTAYYSHVTGQLSGTFPSDDEENTQHWSGLATNVTVRHLQVRLQSDRAPTLEEGPRSAAFLVLEKVTPVNTDGTTGTPEVNAKGSITLTVKVGERVASKVETTGTVGDLIVPIMTNIGPAKVIELRPPTAQANQIIEWSLLPVELYSDLNNDGQLTSADAALVGKPYESGASDEEKAKGTEYMFVNDQISNGAHDREDTSSDDPSEDDDDAKGIHIKVGLNTGKVWLDHPAIDALTFYKQKSCYPEEKLKLKEADPFDLEGTEQLPDTIYARCDGDLNVPDDNPQSLGDLILKYLPKSGGQYIQLAKTKVVVVKEYGAEDFFQTANDYIMENNAKMYSGQKDYDNKPLDRVAVTVMRQEATKMEVLDTVNNANPWVAGIRDVVAAHPDADVIINGNMTFNRIPLPDGGEITKQCHGRLVSGSRVLPGYSDNPNSNIPAPRPWVPTDLIYGHPLRGSDLAGISGKYLAMKGKGEFFFVKGRVKADLATMTPAAGMTEAMGGLGTNYAFVSEAGYVGSAKLPNAKKMLFTVIVMNPGRSSGLDLRIADDAKKGGVQKLRLRDTDGGAIEDHELELFRTDGASSLALAVRQPGPAGALKVTVEGSKHIGRVVNDYVIHTYLSFTIDRPRGEVQ